MRCGRGHFKKGTKFWMLKEYVKGGGAMFRLSGRLKLAVEMVLHGEGESLF